MHAQYKQGYLEALLHVQVNIGKRMAVLEEEHAATPANWFGRPRAAHHYVVERVRELKQLGDALHAKARETAKKGVNA